MKLIGEPPVGKFGEPPVGNIVEPPVGKFGEPPVGNIVEPPVGKIGKPPIVGRCLSVAIATAIFQPRSRRQLVAAGANPQFAIAPNFSAAKAAADC